ncbi:hypothetical protein N9Y60_00185 [Crocinitomicaceae bacterium]|nr:hypothetical protein [Crocinitomicaceae bacterium]MDB3906794.1 hypothetical protein [Crocinitomicaceae bacterium]MDC0257865.1 hypothetical protein [Crocinitomicaceae bacterium]
MKAILLFFLLFLSVPSWSQNSYVQKTIVDGDTSVLYQSGQMYWKLFQGTKDAIIESNLPEGRSKSDIKYPIISREYDGYETRFHVKKGASEVFDIVFHSGDNSVTYIYDGKTVIYRGSAVRFTLHD